MGFLPLLPFQLILLCDVMKNYGWKISTTLQFYFIAGMLMILFVYFTRNTVSCIYFDSRDDPNNRFTMEKKVNHNLPFLDALIVNNDPKFFSNQNLP